MSKRKLVIPDISKPPPPPPPRKNENPFDALMENDELKVPKKSGNKPISYEYDVVPVQLGFDLREFIGMLKKVLQSKASEGWRYKNSIRKNTSEEVLIFERGIYD